MKFNFTDTLFALSYALDCVEHDLIGITNGHGKRVAYLSARMGQSLGLNQEHLLDLCTCAVLHDCALAEYVLEEYQGSFIEAASGEQRAFASHCVLGEDYMAHIPFAYPENAKNTILYHHETADGRGPFRRTTFEVPLYARLIHLADTLDTEFNLSYTTQEKISRLDSYLKQNTDSRFDIQTISCFRKTFDFSELAKLRDEKINLSLYELFPSCKREITPQQLMDFSNIFATITDYKSKFTKKHSIGIAHLSKRMAEYYGADEELTAKLYFAGALHDIGKLAVDRDILEKPGRLSDMEYKHIQAHAYQSFLILSQIEGLEDITRWASYHHEKLDGSGYPFHLTGKDLDHWSRMIACLDTYQALTEERPYKEGMSHAQACAILQNLADDGKLDAKIVQDISQLLG